MKISIIIPTLNEASCIAHTIEQTRRLGPHEILVVDAGSTDDTLALSQQADRVLTGVRGRAAQMNHGASHASGDALLFLHADCTLGPAGLLWIERTLRRRVAAGCFRMRIPARGMLYRSIEGCATARVCLTGIIYGDQALFLSRELFEKIEGFPPVRFMEDVLISLRLRREGRMVVVPEVVHVSPRRWVAQGVIRQTLRNWSLTALAALGVPPDRLARHYPVVR